MATIPTVYYQVTNDLFGERTTDARSIGLLDPDRTMLNLQSALATTTDKLDTYRFRLTKDGPIGLSIIPADKEGTQLDPKAVKVEVLNRGGRVVADSTATSGDLKSAWDDIAATNYKGKKGDYYVRISRGPESSSSAIVQYNLQVRSTFNYRDDYTTIEKPATQAAVATYGSTGAINTLINNLNTPAYTKQSDSQKLFAAITPTFV